MLKSLCVLVVLVSVGVLSQDPVPQPSPLRPPPVPRRSPRRVPPFDQIFESGEFVGTILGKNGRPIPYIDIEVIDSVSNQIITTTTPNSEGRFEISDLSLGSYKFRVKRFGSTLWTSPSYSLTPENRIKEVTLECCVDVPAPVSTSQPTRRPPKPTAKPSPTPTPAESLVVKVENLDFSSRTQLEEWLDGQAKENRRLVRIINMGGQTGIFVLVEGHASKQPKYEVTYEPGIPDTKNLKRRIELNLPKIFVGIHRLGDTAYLMVFYE